MNAPASVAVDTAGNVYVADTGNNQVEEYTSLGMFVRTFAVRRGHGGRLQAVAMNHPSGVAVDLSGNIYVADTGNNQVEKLSPNGVLLATFTANGLRSGGGGTPRTVEESGGGERRRRRQHLRGRPRRQSDRAAQSHGELHQSVHHFWVSALGIESLMNGPSGVAVDAAGDVYVADTGNNQVEKLSPSGALLATYTASGVVPGLGGTVAKLRGPVGVTVDASRPPVHLRHR